MKKTTKPAKAVLITDVKSIDAVIRKPVKDLVEIVKASLDRLDADPSLDPKGILAQTIFALTKQELVKRGIKLNDAENMLCE